MFSSVNPRQSFPELEKEILSYWKEHQTFQKSLLIRKGKEAYTFYDGPPFATGTPHYGHLLAGTIKDAIPRYFTMQWRYVERRFGWDCHGLPIENKVEEKMGISGKKDIEEKIGVHEFNEECRRNVFWYVDEWRNTVERMARWVDMDHDYKTMDSDFMESVWWVFKTIYNKGYVYESYRVVPYCIRCSTPLSNFEVNQWYEDKQDKTVTVKFRVKGNESKYILAWTTTPWTLPANLWLAVGEDILYAEVLDRESGDTYILAKDRLKAYYKNETDYTMVREYEGSCLVWIEYEPLFNDFILQKEAWKLSKDIELKENAYHVVLGHHVTTESGTGVVHIAPAYGEDDFQIGKKEWLGFISHIDSIGHTYGLLEWNDIAVFDFNQMVIDRLKKEKSIIHIGTIDHSYPHCYRCKTPLIYRAISAWYVNVEKMKDRMIANNEAITWVPETIKYGRFGKWLEWARDWNISRNRYWGSAIPVWKSEDGEIMVIGSIQELFEANKPFGQIYEKDGAYFYVQTNKPVDLHKHFVDTIKLQKDGKTFTRIPEVLDCWFESGAMPYASAHYPFENKEEFERSFPANFIAEWLDQTRGWFYTLLILGTALFDSTPFLNVIVNGLVLAEDGKKMSKSLKNYPDPNAIIDVHGADALRFFLLSSPVVKAEDLRFSKGWVEEAVKKVLLPLWNTYSFFTTYANIDGWEPPKTSFTFMRHGQTNANAWKLVSDGGDNSLLNATGIDQVKHAAEDMKDRGYEFDIIISSPLERALETATIVAKETGYQWDIIVMNEFTERSAGSLSGKSFDEIEALYRKKMGKDFPENTHYKVAYEIGDGEEKHVFQERTESWIEKLRVLYPWKRLLIVAHGGTFRSFNEYFFWFSDFQHGIGNAEYVDFPTRKLSNPLDVWVYSRLERLKASVAGGFESYDLQIPTRAIAEFMDDLTNWYVRRSRRRFWKSENDSDKFEAYETLYHVLITLTKIIAPITPMIAEAVYRWLTSKESVHLERYPHIHRALMFDHLESDMKRARDIITLWLALRSEKKIRVRQPLKSITLGESIDPFFEEIIKEELNVKTIQIENMSNVAIKICKPNARLIGPRFMWAVQAIITQAKSGNFIELPNGRIQVGEYLLEEGEFEIAYEPIEWVSLDVMSGSGLVIAMDTTLTNELILEWFARDLVRLIQDMRKEAGYIVSDRIRLMISWENSEEILSLFTPYITTETLSSIEVSIEEWDMTKTVDIEGKEFTITLKKA